MLDALEADYAAHARHSFTVQPVTTVTPDSDLGCAARRVVAYKSRCTCGWDSAWRPTFAAARALGQVHRALEHPR